MLRPSFLVTGADGQIGKTLCEYLSKLGIKHYGMSKQQLDITNYANVKESLSNVNFDVLVNCAAYTNTEEAEKNEVDAFSTNRDGVLYLAEVCNKKNAYLIHLSTNCVFDGSKESPYVEIDLPNPQSVYGKSKYAGEQVILNNSKRALILRTSWIFSQHPGHNFVLKIMDIAKRQGFLKVVNDQFGRPTSAFSLAEALVKITPALIENQDACSIYHFGGNKPVSWFDFSVTIFQIAQKLGLIQPIEITPIKTGEIATQVNRPKNGVLDCSKIESFLNISLPDWRSDVENLIYKLGILVHCTNC